MKYRSESKRQANFSRPWEMAATIISRRADMDTPEKEMWFAVLVQAIRDIDSRHHSKYFWKEDNLKLYCGILRVNINYIIKALNFAGYDAGALI